MSLGSGITDPGVKKAPIPDPGSGSATLESWIVGWICLRSESWIVGLICLPFESMSLGIRDFGCSCL